MSPSRTFSWEIYKFFGSNQRRCFTKKAVLKNFAIFTAKLQACNFTKNRIQHRCFPLNIAKFFTTPISKKICPLRTGSVLTL